MGRIIALGGMKLRQESDISAIHPLRIWYLECGGTTGAVDKLFTQQALIGPRGRNVSLFQLPMSLSLSISSAQSKNSGNRREEEEAWVEVCFGSWVGSSAMSQVSGNVVQSVPDCELDTLNDGVFCHFHSYICGTSCCKLNNE